MSVLEVKDLCKTYVVNKRQNNVLKNVTFAVEDGEMVAIMGPSGSGKSTLLYAVSGMDSATSGNVLFEGRDLTRLNNKEQALRSLLFLHANISHFSAYNVIERSIFQ